MSGRSSVLVFALVIGAVFSILYASTLTARPGHAHSEIPIEAKASQIQAIEIIENDVKSKLPGVQQVKLVHYLYNYSLQEAMSNPHYDEDRRKSGYWRSFDGIKQHPDLLQMPLLFVHANGTSYGINESARTYQKVCDEPSPICPLGRIQTIAAKDRLVYRAEIRWEPASEETGWYNEGYYVIDAESGQIVWNSIDYERNRKPMPNVNFDNRTIAQLLKERLSPPDTARVSIESGSSNKDNKIGYLPEVIRTTLGIDSKIAWTNTDSVAHTVVSDTDYFNDYTGHFESKLIEPNDTYEYAFFDTGTYPYHCKIHPWMRGVVEVVENFT